ncbi:MAG: hypothetical protein VX593_07075 [Pseudomonadota bacterium]|nr:hypothetical protein [Pseudomonadota bacterium]
MSEKLNFEKTAKERREEWEDSVFAHGDDAHFWDFAMCIAQVLEETMEALEVIVGEKNAAEPLRLLVENAATSAYQDGSHDWRVLIEDTLEVGTMWPICDKLYHAAQFGIYGVTPASIVVSERSAWIDAVVAEVCDFSSRKTVAALGPSNAILRIAAIASSRQAMDHGEGEVDLSSLAIFGDVTEGRLRNLLSDAASALKRGPNGGVSASSALAWLQKRKSFYNSIWQYEEPEDEEESSEQTLSPIHPDKLIFVPMARDGSTFHPGLKRSDYYQIGGKGEEQQFEDFDAALAALNAMPVPRWRRPNDQGNWGIVSGVSWQRVERSF